MAFFVAVLGMVLIGCLILYAVLRRARRKRELMAEKPAARVIPDAWVEAGRRAEPETRIIPIEPGPASAGVPSVQEEGDPLSARSNRPIAVITGGAKRVGRAIAMALARSGCDIVLMYHTSVQEASDCAQELRSIGASVRLVRLDLSDLKSVDAVGAGLARDLPRLDVLVHNAAIYGATRLEELTPETAERFARINSIAPLLLTRHLAPRLSESARAGGGSIVAMLDIHAMGRPRAGYSAYAMSKAALHEMVRTLARELAPTVRVNGVAPGVVAWPESGDESDELAQREYTKRVPLGRAGTPEDAAEAVRWLSLDASYTTGAVIRVDGGRSIG